MKSKGGTASLKCRRLFYWRALEMVGSVFLCPQQICPPAANVPAVTNLRSLYHPHTYAIGGRRLLIYFSALLFVSKSVRSVTLYGCDDVTNIGGNEIYEKHSVQMKGFLVNVVIYFFLLQNNEYPAQLSFSRCKFTGWSF